MKKYVRPMLECEQFAANEFVASCWEIDCDVPYGYGFVDGKGGETGIYDKGIDTLILGSEDARYQGCWWGNSKHDDHDDVSMTTKPKPNGYWQAIGKNGKPVGQPFECFYWSGEVEDKTGSFHVADCRDDDWLDDEGNAS